MKNLIRFSLAVVMIFVVINCFAMAGLEIKNLKGQTAPSFSLKNLNDEIVNSDDFFGKKPVLLFFWATWCPHCQSAIKELNSKASALKSRGAEVITVDLGESKTLVSSYMKEHKYNLTVLLDKEQALVESYGVVGVPTFFIIGKDGKIKSKVNLLPEDYEKILLSN